MGLLGALFGGGGKKEDKKERKGWADDRGRMDPHERESHNQWLHERSKDP